MPAETEKKQRFNYPLRKILSDRNDLTEQLRFDFEGREITGPHFELLLERVGEFFKGRIDPAVLQDTVRHLAGTSPSAETLKATAHRLCGNFRRLAADGRAVPPWVVQKFREWVPVQIMNVRRQRLKSGKLGGVFEFRVLAGTPCPLTVRKWWSLGQCRYWATKHFGFSRPPGQSVQAKPAKYPFMTFEQLVGMRLYVLMEPELCGHQEPMFGQHVKVPPSVAAWNKELLRHRFRIDPGYGCPQEYPTVFPCHRCMHGYLGTCPVGTHPYDYELKPCAQCGKDKAPFDPARGDAMCVNCYLKQEGEKT